MISDIADLIVEISKERTEINCPVRQIYAVYREIAAELGRRMNTIRSKERQNKKQEKIWDAEKDASARRALKK